MKASEILDALSESEELTNAVLASLDQGMWEEWDIGLADALKGGFGVAEISIAARSATHYAQTLFEGRKGE